jgi:glutamine amidotransferase
MKKITILDYGMGNIQSLFNAIKFLGHQPTFYSESNQINTSLCILPGVGAFNHAMKLILKKKLNEKIKNFLQNKDCTLFGICLGMQLLFHESQENGFTKGLGLIDGKIEKLKSNKSHILPNVGWYHTDIEPNEKYSYLSDFNNEKFYYIHSYYVKTDNIINQLGTSKYHEKKFCAITVKDRNIIGTQFHPEKSSWIGLEFLKSLINNTSQ